jgi:hypothetical protein
MLMGCHGAGVAKPDGYGGHYFNIVNDNGTVRLLDGQIGKEVTWQQVIQGAKQASWNSIGLLMTN